MVYDYYIGQRVRCIKKHQDGLSVGETGTVIELCGSAAPTIKWDKYNPIRHDAGGRVPDGHGWYIRHEHITPDAPLDLGEFNTGPIADMSLLFGK